MNAADAIKLAQLIDRATELGEAIGDPLECEVGKRYIRLVQRTMGGGAHVHAFIDITNGDLLKAAGWKAPAKGARGNVLDDADFARILATADRFGSYLYLR